MQKSTLLVATQVETLTASPTAIPNDGSLKATLTAMIVDDSGNPAPATDVLWGVNEFGALSETTSPTDESGMATVTVASSGDPAKQVITATATTAEDPVGKSVSLTSTPALLAPQVFNAEDGELDFYDVSFGVTARVPHYSGAASGDIVTFMWGTESSVEFAVEDPNVDLPYDINVSDDMSPDALLDGVYDVYYVRKDVAGNESISAALSIIVNDKQTNPTLPAPALPDAVDGYINYIEASDGAEVDIAVYPAMAVDDVITLYWEGYTNGGAPIDNSSFSDEMTVAEIADVTFTVPADKIMVMGENAYANVYYKVEQAGATGLLLSFTTAVQVDVI
ncbi:Bacterial Ig-like domain (group 1) [compost metagenome]|uniref:Ig-like domain-containing protein n=1 Tax=Kluyvera intermedia TaxID=61648 RepID=UPI000FB61B99